jgi:hypothetical protein
MFDTEEFQKTADFGSRALAYLTWIAAALAQPG